jgi:hypothetical protein
MSNDWRRARLEEIEGLWLKSYGVAPSAQLAPVRVKRVVFKQIAHSLSAVRVTTAR